MNVKLQFVSDIVCPWCALGYQKLRETLEKLDSDITVDVTCVPYELNPELGQEGVLLSDHLAHIMNANAGRIAQVQERMTKLGKEVDFKFNFTPATRIYNTHKAHQLMYLAAKSDKALHMHAALMKSYFTDGEDISDTSVLLKLAKETGLDQQQVNQTLANNSFSEDVNAAISQVRAMGISGVPAYIIGDDMLQGSREVGDLMEFIQRASKVAIDQPG